MKLIIEVEIARLDSMIMQNIDINDGWHSEE